MTNINSSFSEESGIRLSQLKSLLGKGSNSEISSQTCLSAYQEFDSLYGAARAMDMPDLETLCQNLASYMLYINSLLPAKLSQFQQALLQDGLNLLDDALLTQRYSTSHIHDFLHELSTEINKGGTIS
ncbi:MAG: hypothetical protein CMF50_04390 [Legionellales bacterium]|nr:hypothetical protein [Legionellales bacterium]|tara:strand:+ start:8171 stop:8554 length:384 start_codon:yes stop_codon:yes gene_type:complete